MKRQFQFSVDSFQILIDPLLDYYERISKYQQQTNKKQPYHHHGKHQLVMRIKNSSCIPFFLIEKDKKKNKWFSIAIACAK